MCAGWPPRTNATTTAGNFHVILLLHPDDPAGNEAQFALNERLVDRAIAMGGTCTGEHGVGVRLALFCLCYYFACILFCRTAGAAPPL